MLLIITDGAISDMDATTAAIVEVVPMHSALPFSPPPHVLTNRPLPCLLLPLLLSLLLPLLLLTHTTPNLTFHRRRTCPSPSSLLVLATRTLVR